MVTVRTNTKVRLIDKRYNISCSFDVSVHFHATEVVDYLRDNQDCLIGTTNTIRPTANKEYRHFIVHWDSHSKLKIPSV